jgi:hypothetical protein
MSDLSSLWKKNKAALIAGVIAFIAFFGGVAVGFQSFSGLFDALVLKVPFLVNLLLGIAGGAICSTTVNFFLNLELLEDFSQRLMGKKPFPHFLDASTRVKYWLGIIVFLISGLLSALAVFAVGATGGWMVLAVIAGLMVSLVTIPQEVETWLASFDDPVVVLIGKKIYEIENSDTVEGSIDSEFYLELQKVTLIAEYQKIKDNFDLRDAPNDELNQALKITKKHLKTQSDLELARNFLLAFYAQQQDAEKVAAIKAVFDAQIDRLREIQAKNSSKDEILDQLKELKKQAELNQPHISTAQALKKWWLHLTPSRCLGLFITLGNVFALSLLFGISFATFLVSVGVLAFPALIAGLSIGFTVGAFTQFRFYEGFLTDFCAKIEKRWHDLLKSPKWGIGVGVVLTNAIINGVLNYTGVVLLQGLLVAAGLSAPPLLALALVVAVFSFTASLLLGSDFWIKSAEKVALKITEFLGLGGQEKDKQQKEDMKPLLNVDEIELKPTEEPAQFQYQNLFKELCELKPKNVTTDLSYQLQIV